MERALRGLDERVGETVSQAVAEELDRRLPALLSEVRLAASDMHCCALSHMCLGRADTLVSAHALWMRSGYVLALLPPLLLTHASLPRTQALHDAFFVPTEANALAAEGKPVADDGASSEGSDRAAGPEGSPLALGLAEAVAKRVARRMARGALSNSATALRAPAATPHGALPPQGAFSQNVPRGDGWDAALPTVSADVLSPHIDVHAPTHAHRAATRAEAARREQEAAAAEEARAGGDLHWGSGEEDRSEPSGGPGSVEGVSGEGLWEATVTLMGEDEAGVPFADQGDDVPTATYRA